MSEHWHLSFIHSYQEHETPLSEQKVYYLPHSTEQGPAIHHKLKESNEPKGPEERSPKVFSS